MRWREHPTNGIVTAAGSKRSYDSVILASPAWAASAMLQSVDAALSSELAAIPYSSSITINLLYDEDQIGDLPEGFGFLVPASEGRILLACTFVHRKFLGRTPTGKVVLRAFLGGMKNEALMAESDAALVAAARRELTQILGEKIIGRDAQPEHTQVSRWCRAMAPVRRRPPRPHRPHQCPRRPVAGIKARRQCLRRHRHLRRKLIWCDPVNICESLWVFLFFRLFEDRVSSSRGR
jgi:hypothetical protein